jgi:hypothetical protein
MAYVINKFSGSQLLVLEDGTLDTSTSLGLVGRNYTGYGEIQNENFLFLLENFANENPPGRPVEGQTWFNKSTKSLNIYNGTDWGPVGSTVVSNSEPVGFDGALWYKDSTKQLYIFESETGLWNLVGPEAIENFAETKIRAITLRDNSLLEHPVLAALVNGVVTAIISPDTFIINELDVLDGFFALNKGINLSSTSSLTGAVIGNASTADTLKTGRMLNDAYFDGSSNVTLTASTTKSLLRGAYLSGDDFNGSKEIQWSVNASTSNIIGTVVARDASGNFEAGTITADLVGNVQGNVTATSGISYFSRIEATEFVGATLSGNAFSASQLQTARTINGVQFNGTQNITIPVAAADVTGIKLAANVVESSLTTLGVLTSLVVNDAGITVGSNLTLKEDGDVPSVNGNSRLKIGLTSDNSSISFYDAISSLALGSLTAIPSLVPEIDNNVNLGLSTRRFSNVYSNLFVGTATQAQYADLAEKYTADGNYEPGMVVMFGGPAEVTLAENETSRVAGVISTNPAYLMNAELHDTNVAVVALQGRVPCFVKGSVKKGDMLISAGDGYAKSAGENPKIGTVIGKALADFNGTQGVIEVVVGRI